MAYSGVQSCRKQLKTDEVITAEGTEVKPVGSAGDSRTFSSERTMSAK